MRVASEVAGGSRESHWQFVCHCRNAHVLLSRGLRISVMFLTSCLLVAVMLQVATRYVGISIAWTEEISRYILVWLTFLGVANLAQDHKLISTGALEEIFHGNGRIRSTLTFLERIVFYSVFFVVFWWGAKLAILNFSQTFSTVPRLPMALVHSAIPAGCLSALVLRSTRFLRAR